MRHIPPERFDRTVDWPEPRPEPRTNLDHPDEIPDTPDGPFKDWLELHRPDQAGDEEIGYEGQR